jgi:hypothetical protein
MKGPFSLHTAIALPYYTPEMHQNFLSDQRETLFQVSLIRIRKEAETFREVRYLKCIILVQSWWRRMLVKRGLELKSKRAKVRLKYRLNKAETKRTRRGYLYRVKDFWGLAPMLKTDSREEAALKRTPFFFRHRARLFIWCNRLEFWLRLGLRLGHYHRP